MFSIHKNCHLTRSENKQTDVKREGGLRNMKTLTYKVQNVGNSMHTTDYIQIRFLGFPANDAIIYTTTVLTYSLTQFSTSTRAPHSSNCSKFSYDSCKVLLLVSTLKRHHYLQISLLYKY